MALDSAFDKLSVTTKRLFADPEPAPDETSFQVDNTSAAYYESPYYKLHKDDLQPVPPPRVPDPRVDLTEVLGADFLAPIVRAKRLSFHAVGDTGAAKVNLHTTAARAIAAEANVADAMAADVRAGGPTGRPSSSISATSSTTSARVSTTTTSSTSPSGPMTVRSSRSPETTTAPCSARAAASRRYRRSRRSCGTSAPSCRAARPTKAPSSARTMNQPGVYFTLDAPFVSIVGLYTNVLEGPGVISTQNGKYPALGGDHQLDWLKRELRRLAPARKAGERAVILACHHPPVSVDAKHGGTTGLADDIDVAARAAGFWPDAILSGHAHLYQRYTRRVDGREIPYVVSGSGGFAATSPVGGLARAPITVGEYTLVKKPLVQFGYLTVTVDMSGATPYLTITFNDRTRTTTHDTLRLNLERGTIG